VISVYQRSSRRPAWLPALGPVVLAAALTAGCSASAASPSPASSGSPGSGGSASISQCLKKHGVTPPPGFGQGGGPGGAGGQAGGHPRARPTGGAASTFRNALKACGATGFHGGANSPG
jgi:hypothetical protein